MASGYLTSDGKDLDARYLGINAKAKSASTADTATTATNANYANSAGSSGSLSANAYVRRTGDPVTGTIGGVYTVPTTGLAAITEDYPTLNGKEIGDLGIRTTRGWLIFLLKGEQIRNSGSSCNITIYPVHVK